ncbi:TPA: hypothetical protein RQK04_003157 [Vibrio vulnificus]|nr:hypothetical protein [Vibrio vulnificus]
MPRRKPVLYEKTVYLFTPKAKPLSIHNKHLLIITLQRLFGFSPDKATAALESAFKKAGLHQSFPKRSAHSTYKTKHIKTLKPLKELSNKKRIALTLIESSVVELDSSKDETYQGIEMPITVDILDFPPWYKQNREFIQLLGNFISTERKYESESHQLLLEAVRRASPPTEKHLIETSLKFYKKHIGQPSTNKVANKQILDAKLVIFNTINDEVDDNHDEDTSKEYKDSYTATHHHDEADVKDNEQSVYIIYLLVKPSKSIKYIPFKITNLDPLYRYLGSIDSTYSVYAIKDRNQLTLELVISDKSRIKYKATIEQDFQQDVPNPFTGQMLFNKFNFWDPSLPDKKHTIVRQRKIHTCNVKLSTSEGHIGKRSIRYILQRMHQSLSLTEFHDIVTPKMFIERPQAYKTKPILLTWPCEIKNGISSPTD